MIPFRTAEQVTAALPTVVAHLARRGLIAYPTETVYGFGSVTALAAVEKLAALKGREPGKPFLVLVSNRRMLAAVGLRLTDAAERFAAAFWPGPLTLVLPGGEGTLPDALRGPEGGVAVRWTSHHGAAQLIQTLGSPITSTSANRPGQPSLMEAPAIERTSPRPSPTGRCSCSTRARCPSRRLRRWWIAPAARPAWCAKAPSRGSGWPASSPRWRPSP